MIDDGPSARRLSRGICRALAALGYATLTEFPLGSGRRVDVIAVNGAGETLTALGVVAIPVAWVIDRNGTIVWNSDAPGTLDEAIVRELAKSG